MGYDSPYGTGNRTASITVTTTLNFHANPDLGGVAMFVNGNKTEEQMWSADALTGNYLRFQFLESIIMDHLKWYQADTTTHGVVKVQGSNDGTNWTDIGTSFSLGGATAQEIDISGNVTEYTYYQLLGVSGSINSPYPWIYEMEFSWTYPVSPSDIKSISGIPYANIKSIDGLAIASVKSIDGVV